MASPYDSLRWHVGLVGYGEVGRILAEDLRKEGLVISACDTKMGTAEEEPLARHAVQHGVRLVASHGEMAAGADLLISAVTASQTVPAAEACANQERQGIEPGTFYLDFNSASPAAKMKAAEVVDGAGGYYVEGAVMTSIPPYRIRVPLLLGGPHAAALAPMLTTLGFDAKVASEKLGVASATKMCRSVMIKGMEAMVIESLTAARGYGVEDRVLASLAETFPGIDWEKQADYFFKRVIQHGRRRAEEMREVAQTVREAGLEPWSASGSAERAAWMAELADGGRFGTAAEWSEEWRAAADRIIKVSKVKHEL